KPSIITHKQENSNSKQERTKEHIMRRTQDYTSQRSTSMAIVGGSILEVMDDLIKEIAMFLDEFYAREHPRPCHKAKKGWIKELCLKHRINFVALQETKMESINLFTIKSLWGNFTFEYATSSSVGNFEDLQDFNSIEFLELSQKAKARWAIEGDENSKYFHGILNNKRSQLAIRGILIDEIRL
nr:RNA-directed DNA polymerase, eukaryota [Tanacetum cinerariifolium]